MLSKTLYKALGFFFFGLGAVGALIPLLPTTVFWILAAVCFSKGAPEWFDWLQSHPSFGPVLKDFLEHGVISRRGKLFAVLGMSGGCALSVWLATPPTWVVILIVAVVVAAAAWVLSHPSEVKQ